MNRRRLLLIGALVVLLTAGAAIWWWRAPVELADPAPDLDAEEQAACEAFVAALPATLDGGEPRTTDTSGAPGAAYGRPALTVSCGVVIPEEFSLASECVEANGVGWWAPPAQYDDQSADVTIYAVSYRPAVLLTVPGSARPAGLAGSLAELAEAVESQLIPVRDCL